MAAFARALIRLKEQRVALARDVILLAEADEELLPGKTVDDFIAKIARVIVVASTDATPWRERGVSVYGIGPFPVDSESLRRIHGDDERVEIKALHQGAEFVYRLVVDVAARK